MTRPKGELKKIEKIAARRVAFSKRKRGLFKKAQELSTLCDAEIALTVFSTAGKLFEYATSSVEHVFERYNLHGSIGRSKHSCPKLQAGNDACNYYVMREKVTDKTRELRILNGEELQGLKLVELQKLEKLLSKALARVKKEKDERIAKDMTTLKNKSAELVQDSRRLKQMQGVANDQGQSSKSIMICIPSNDVKDSDNYDASLPLGSPLFK